MFDLNQQLNQWYSKLQVSGIYEACDIEELKAHLLDTIEDLESKGLEQEEAFLVAQHRLGDVQNLNQEFGKINYPRLWKQRIIWLIAGYFIVSALLCANGTKLREEL